MALRRLGFNSAVIWVLSAGLAWAAAPSRTYTYVTDQTIDPSQVTTNEDNLYAYLQAGVDTYSAGSVNTAALADNAVTSAKISDGVIVNADVSSSAAIAGSKLAGPINTATALAANGANCSAGNYPLGVDASGAVESCTAISVATPVYGRVLRTAGDVTTTSTSLVDLTGASITATTGANPVLLGFSASMSHGSLTEAVSLNFDIDGSVQLGTVGLDEEQLEDVSASVRRIRGMTYQSAVLTAASHTFKVQWRTSAGTATIKANGTYDYIFWMAEEGL